MLLCVAMLPRRPVATEPHGDDPDALLRELQDHFPKAELVDGDAEFERWVARVAGLVEAPSLSLDLPLDIRGKAFQQRV